MWTGVENQICRLANRDVRVNEHVLNNIISIRTWETKNQALPLLCCVYHLPSITVSMGIISRRGLFKILIFCDKRTAMLKRKKTPADSTQDKYSQYSWLCINVNILFFCSSFWISWKKRATFLVQKPKCFTAYTHCVHTTVVFILVLHCNLCKVKKKN